MNKQPSRTRERLAAIACWILLGGAVPFLFWAYTNGPA